MPTRDDVATTQYHRDPPLPVRPTILAPEPPRPTRTPTPRLPFPQLPRPGSPCPTCPFRQLPDPPATATGTAIQLRPPTEPRHPAPANAPRHATATHHHPPTEPRHPAPANAPRHATATHHHPPTASDTATQLLPPTGTGMTTVIQVAPPPSPRRPAPPRRSPVAALQIGLWLVIAVGLLVLAFRS